MAETDHNLNERQTGNRQNTVPPRTTPPPRLETSEGYQNNRNILTEHGHFQELQQTRRAEAQQQKMLANKETQPLRSPNEGQRNMSESGQTGRTFSGNERQQFADSRTASMPGRQTAAIEKARLKPKFGINNRQGKNRTALRQSAKTAAAATTAFTEISSDDWYHWVVIMLSILADLFTLIPILGTFLAIVFGILIWLLYAMNGHYKKRVGAKAATLGITVILELIPFLDALPFFTLSAIINYWLSLADKKVKRQDREKQQQQELQQRKKP